MVTPIVGSLPSQIRMSKLLGLFDSFAGLWFMSATFLGTYYLVFHGIFKGLSWEYAEAAIMDGAGHFKIMTGIMFPLAKNTISTIFILMFIGFWNDYQTPLIYIPNMPTAAYGLYTFINGNIVDGSLQSPPIQLAGGMVLLLPILVVFLVFKDKLMGNISVGGLKG
jgi:multiple sugar transport system permease protein